MSLDGLLLLLENYTSRHLASDAFKSDRLHKRLQPSFYGKSRAAASAEIHNNTNNVNVSGSSSSSSRPSFSVCAADADSSMLLQPAFAQRPCICLCVCVCNIWRVLCLPRIFPLTCKMHIVQLKCYSKPHTKTFSVFETIFHVVSSFTICRELLWFRLLLLSLTHTHSVGCCLPIKYHVLLKICTTFCSRLH